MIPYGKQTISQADIDAVVSVLRSDYLTQGPAIPRFEKAIADACGVNASVAMNSATSALHVACLALNVGPGQRVWTSPITFVASANCARYCGADADFVDIDAATWNLDPQALEDKLRVADREKKLPSVIIPVHFTGQPCDLREIHALASRYGVRIIEDASHAIGARYQDTVIGDCRYSDVTIFSFHPVKIITTAEGGLATARDPAVLAHMARLRTHGITRNPAEMSRAADGPWYYEQVELGFNYRMTDVQAALGASQVSNLKDWLARRHAIADRYDEALRDLPLTLPVRQADRYSALHLYVVRVQPEAKLDRAGLYSALRADGIAPNVHYIPVHLQPDYAKFGFKRGDFPRSEAYYDSALTLPMYPALSDGEQDHVIDALRRALR
jgi:UDP-4-amino-4,6-dideoxy-N-acetyl-beta-L-altrosamine transaminase